MMRKGPGGGGFDHLAMQNKKVITHQLYLCMYILFIGVLMCIYLYLCVIHVVMRYEMHEFGRFGIPTSRQSTHRGVWMHFYYILQTGPYDMFFFSFSYISSPYSSFSSSFTFTSSFFLSIYRKRHSWMSVANVPSRTYFKMYAGWCFVEYVFLV